MYRAGGVGSWNGSLFSAGGNNEGALVVGVRIRCGIRPEVSRRTRVTSRLR